MQKITEENQRLLRRIQEVPPAYNHLDWEEDYKRKEVIKRSMSLYPEYYKKKEEEETMKRTGEMVVYSNNNSGSYSMG